MDNENKISLQEISAPKNQPILINGEQVEVMAPAGSRESLAAALQAGADSIYFGIEALNMRAHSASRFTIDDLRDIATICAERGVKSYLTVNTIIYDDDLELMRQICDAAHEAGISAVIAADVAVMDYCNRIGQEVHLSTQLNISNTEALRFYARFADVVVLARELNMFQVHHIRQFIDREQIKGPSGEPLRIEMFCHGALCMAVSGKCYLSLDNLGRSANRGECMQVCRRAYTVRDRDTGVELDIDNKYIMSPKDLKTIGFIDKMVGAGVRVFKIEGRARSAEYVYNVVRCYKEALQAVADGTFTPERVAEWDEKLSTVFNRGFWDGYYQGQRLGEWNHTYGSLATRKKIYAAKCTNFFKQLKVAEFLVEAVDTIQEGQEVLITGATTGVYQCCLKDIRDTKGNSTTTVHKGEFFSIKTETLIHRGDRLYLWINNTTLEA